MTSEHETAASWIEKADAILITAGAGIGVDSGLPDFRGDQGFWNAYPRLKQQQMSFTDIANAKNFLYDYELAWGFYGHRLKLYRQVQPHDGFYILNSWGQSKKYGAFVFTSNVDGHFQKAGFLPERIYECHGSINRLQCRDDCGWIWSADEFNPVVDQDNCRLMSEPPICRECGHVARPNVLMFGDFNWRNEIAKTQHSRYLKWISASDNRVVIELGAGTDIPSARVESERHAGNRLIRINPRASDIAIGQGISFAAGALETLVKINEHLEI